MIKKSCNISKCGRYRWTLDLEISEESKQIIFIGLNPSLSSEEFTDNTTKKIINISKKYSYGKVKIINLFGLISTSPKSLFSDNNPIGDFNNHVIIENLKYWSNEKNCNLWIGWGNYGSYLGRNKFFFNKLKPYLQNKINIFKKTLGPLCIKKTKKLNPIHPLYCPNNSILSEYDLYDCK